MTWPTPGARCMTQAATVTRRTRWPRVPGTPGEPGQQGPMLFPWCHTRCVMCKCLPSKCDCNPLAEDPDSFCSGGDVCKVRLVMVTSDGDPVCPGLRVSAPVPPRVLVWPLLCWPGLQLPPGPDLQAVPVSAGGLRLRWKLPQPRRALSNKLQMQELQVPRPRVRLWPQCP